MGHICRFFKGDNERRGELFLISTVDTSQSVISEWFCYKLTFNIFTYLNQINDMNVFFYLKGRKKLSILLHISSYLIHFYPILTREPLLPSCPAVPTQLPFISSPVCPPSSHSHCFAFLILAYPLTLSTFCHCLSVLPSF